MRKVEKKAKNKKQSPFSIIPWIIWFLFLTSTLFLFSENPSKAITFGVGLVIWAVIAKKKGSSLASILMFLLVLPFNITLALPSFVDPYIAGVYVNYLVPTVSILDIFLLLFLASRLIAAIRQIPKWYYFLCAYLVIHTIFHPEVGVVMGSVRILLYSLGIWFGVKEAKKKELLVPVIKIFLVSLIVQMAVGILQFSLGKSIGLNFLGESQLLSGAIGTSFIKLSSGEFLRAYGTFPHPNVLAGYLLFTFLVSSFIYFSKGEKKISIWAIILSSFLLLFTFSRVTILLWVISLFVFAYLTLKGRLFSFLVFERFTNLFSRGDYSFSDRVKLTGEAIRIIKLRLLDGVGATNFTRALENSVPYSVNGLSLLQPVHNIFLLTLAEHGIIAGTIMIGAVVWWRIRAIFASEGIKRVFLILGSICLVAVGMFDHYLITLPQGLSILLISLFL